MPPKPGQMADRGSPPAESVYLPRPRLRSGPVGRGRSEFGRSEIHIISASPSKQPLMVGSTLGVYSVGLIFVSARTKKDIIIIGGSKEKLHLINVRRGRSSSKFVAEENNL